jgi:hypothetical protein
LKTAFSILPENNSEKKYQLLVEAGRDCICLLWYSETPRQIEGLVVYHPEESMTDAELAARLQQRLAADQLPHYESCRIFFNGKASVLVPEHLQYNNEKEALLHLMFGDSEDMLVQQETVSNIGAINLYRIPQPIKHALGDRFYGADFRHSNTCHIPAAKAYDLYCIVYPSSVKMILHKDGIFQFAQLFDYKSPSDVSYYLLQVCAQYGVAASTASLCLAGFIDKDSQLFQEIYRYFLNVAIQDIPDGTSVSPVMRDIPAQFYSFLIPLLSCGS